MRQCRRPRRLRRIMTRCQWWSNPLQPVSVWDCSQFNIRRPRLPRVTSTVLLRHGNLPCSRNCPVIRVPLRSCLLQKHLRCCRRLLSAARWAVGMQESMFNRCIAQRNRHIDVHRYRVPSNHPIGYPPSTLEGALQALSQHPRGCPPSTRSMGIK